MVVKSVIHTLILLTLITFGCIDSTSTDSSVDITVTDSQTHQAISYEFILQLDMNIRSIGVFKFGYKPYKSELTSSESTRYIVLVPGEVLSGKVIDESGNPVGGASVLFPEKNSDKYPSTHIYISNPHLGVTDSKGLFSIPDIRGLTKHIEIHKEGFSDKSHSIDGCIQKSYIGTIYIHTTGTSGY